MHEKASVITESCTVSEVFMKKRIINDLRFVIFAAGTGAVCSSVLWLFLLAVAKGTELLWETVPGLTGSPAWYPVAVCLAGGLVTGLFRWRYGDYPQDMMTVFERVKKTKTYPYRKILILIVAALLPLVLGSSVGPEAGMAGIMTALCCWAGENLRFARKEAALFSEMGASVSLSMLFHSPLFGFFHMEEGNDDMEDEIQDQVLSRSSRVFTYSVAAAAGLGVFGLLNGRVCDVSEGFPSFETALPEGPDYAAMFIYIAAGVFLGYFFEITEKLFEHTEKKLPPVAGETLAGGILGLVVMVLPVVQFSGEHQMGILIEDYALYPAAAMIGIGLLKVVMTNMCIQMGLKGGHFFPLIFAAVCTGYGMALLIWPGQGSHAVFAAAITAAATLGYSMKKPLAVTMLLFICFPLRMFFWIMFAASLGALVSGWRPQAGRK